MSIIFPQGDLTEHYKKQRFFTPPMIAVVAGTAVTTAVAPVAMVPLLTIAGLLLWLNNLLAPKMYEHINKKNHLN